MEGAMQFPRGMLYLIVCKSNEQALRIDNIEKHDNSRVSSEVPNSQNLTQLFFIERINNDEFEIVNALSGFCFDEESGEIHLKRGKQAKDQLFWIERAPVQGFYNYWWIKTSKTSDKALSLEGMLRYKPFDINDETQLFRFEPVNNNNTVLSTTIIVNAKSGKVIDVPRGTHEPGEPLIQWTKNSRFNQRWRFIKTGTAYQIQSFKTGLNLDIAEEKKKPNSKVVQWNPTAASNQLWTIENKGNGNFTIRSVHEPSLVLGIVDDNVEDGGRLAIVNHDCQWRFEGPGPK